MYSVVVWCEDKAYAFRTYYKARAFARAKVIEVGENNVSLFGINGVDIYC